MFNKFYEKTYQERMEILKKWHGDLEEPKELAKENADQIVENYLFNYNLTLGVGVNFIVNGKEYVVPMAVEEPSVIAAASNGAKRLGNITSQVLSNEVIGQMAYTAYSNEKLETFEDKKEEWLNLARNISKSMVERGGGPRDIYYEKHDDLLVVYITFDPCDSMGANALNTLLEELGPVIAEYLEADMLMGILSNDGSKQLVKATCKVPVSTLSKDLQTAKEMARNIAYASKLAKLDPKRAVTHNKGIMNGVSSVVIATGNDSRAVEASCHQYASSTGKYQGLTEWIYNEKEEVLKGEIILPLPVATVGGTLSTHPHAQWSLKLLKNPNAKDLKEVIAAVGLAQNFAAIRALVTSGIQQGHMKMQARSIALEVGAEVEEVPILVGKLIKSQNINRQNAKKLLEELRK